MKSKLLAGKLADILGGDGVQVCGTDVDRTIRTHLGWRNVISKLVR